MDASGALRAPPRQAPRPPKQPRESPGFSRGEHVNAKRSSRRRAGPTSARCALGRFIGSHGLSYVADAVEVLNEDGCPDPAATLTPEQVTAVADLEASFIAGSRFRSEFVGENRSRAIRLALKYPSDVPAICAALDRGSADEDELEHVVQQMRTASGALRDGAL